LNYVEYGKENSDVIILLHGGGLSWWNYKEVAERLQTDYHVVLPILDGHAGCDKQFTTSLNKSSCLKKPVFMRVSAISISLLITN
jgi:esterase/lipase